MKDNIKLEQHIYNFWLDHLEVFWSFKDESLFESLDFDNSNYAQLDEYMITKHEVSKYKYKIVFTRGDYTLFAYYKWLPRWPKQWVSTRDYIVVYSTALKIFEYEEVLYFLELYLKLYHCRRFDIYMDVKFDIDVLLGDYFDKYKTGRDYRKSWKTETRYFWEMKNSKNKRQLIRVYNKNLDIISKNKIDLYQDYLRFDNMTRIELEIRQELAKVRDYREVFDDTLLIWIFKNYLHKYSKIFESLPGEKITLYKKRPLKLPEEDYQGLYYKTQNVKVFTGWARKIYNIWFCPVRVLIWAWYIQDKTKYTIWIDTIMDLMNQEKKVIAWIKEAQYIRNHTDEFHANLYKYGKI